MHARASLTWGAGRNHKITTDVQEEGEAGKRQKRQKKEGHLSLDAICLQGTPALLKCV